MLDFFPTPYPGEWWYGTLCRFYVHSGYPTKAAALQYLYGSANIPHGALYPGASCAAVLRKLPAGIFDIKQVILKNTLLPYYLRIAPQEKKEKTLNLYAAGSSLTHNKVELYSLDGKTGPKFCPMCYAEDIERYGEPYWHRVHQVPLITVCPEHGCRLVHPSINWRFDIKGFAPLCKIQCPPPKPVEEEWERKVAEMIQDFVERPYLEGPDHSYSNLLWVLLSKGFGARAFLKKGALDARKLLQACSKYFDKRVIAQYFNEADHNIFYRVVNWFYKTPERYILLAVFSGLSSDELFGPDLSLDSSIKERLLEMAEDGSSYAQKDVLRQLGITSSQLEVISDRYAIEPFWDRQSGRCEATRMSQLNLCLTTEEKELVRKVAMKNGAEQTSLFARSLLMQLVRALATGDGCVGYDMESLLQRWGTHHLTHGLAQPLQAGKRTIQIGIMLHPDEKERIYKAAELFQTKPAVFARNILLDVSDKILQNESGSFRTKENE